MKGFSVYLGQQSEEKQQRLLSKMKRAGFQTVFTSLHIPEDDAGTYKTALRVLGKQVREHEMELFADVSPASFSHLGLCWEHAGELLHWGVSGLRADVGFSPDQIVSFSKQMKVALNAGTVDRETLQNYLEKGLHVENTEAWHNFYPRPETGLPLQDVQQKNALFHSFGIRTVAFVAGDGVKRGPVYAGVPTVEDQRHVHPFAAALVLWRMADTDKVLVGDTDISEKSMQAFQIFENKAVVSMMVRIGPFEDESVQALVLQTHQQRMDKADYVVRSQTSRPYARCGNVKIPANGGGARPTGTITIDNEQYGRYQGELQITKTDLSASEKVNVVGHVLAGDLPILNVLREGERFCFIERLEKESEQ
ncbi:DUF871 domain-containing protein [Salicibibacter cibarius]|uniref:DUF871 domain-containing protein n=1 Tax=Salicibibacter cibarius TaxID=2743000 RepID=A0A7T6Z715_9BACI|nr:MupG family TIM beta-alpha barrel fold protein [Salicibibacter cibarius]QQK78054.1 DUF871 domain-containing protein [Salicibibacter cibarius]